MQLVGALLDAHDFLGERARGAATLVPTLLEQRDRLGGQPARPRRSPRPSRACADRSSSARTGVTVLTVLCIMSMASSIDWIRSLMSPRSNGVMKLLRTASRTSRVIVVGLVLEFDDLAGSGARRSLAAGQKLLQRLSAAQRGCANAARKGRRTCPRAASSARNQPSMEPSLADNTITSR